MFRSCVACALIASALLAGCATTRSSAPGIELAGRSLRMETARGDITILSFRENGRVRADFRGRTLAGRWQAANRKLCFFWTGAPRECWPYRAPFERGRARSLTSDRGNVLRVTML